MGGKFEIFSAPHIAVLASVPLISMTLGRIARRSQRASTAIAVALGVLLLVNEITWWIWRIRTEGFRFPGAVPLQLCDLIVWCAIIACLTRARWFFETNYYLALTGGALTLITPDLWADCWTYPTIYFFIAHAGIIIAPLFLILSGTIRPARGSVMRALIAVNCWAVLAGTFNLIFETNYMYLCHKPDDATVLDFLGPWPIYLLSGEAIALVAFWLLWLPFRKRADYDTAAVSTASDAVK